ANLQQTQKQVVKTKEKPVEKANTNKDKPILSKSSLLGRFVNASPLHDFILSFQKNNRYKMRHAAPGKLFYNEGTYTIKKQIVYFKPNVCKHEETDVQQISCQKTMGEGFCQIQEFPNDLFYAYYLVCKSTSVKEPVVWDWESVNFAIGSAKKKGEIVSFQGRQVFLLGMVAAKTADGVNMREKPDVTSDKISYSDFDTENNYEFVPKNRELTLIARTLKKKRVKKWNNYWYYVTVKNGNTAWMYGEFIKLR
ncbi:MAG: SH3 domain-containing protein, partial [Spirochaetota bacterium]